MNEVILTIITIILIIPFFIGIPATFGMEKLNFMQALILKTLATGFAGGLIGYFVIVLTLTENKLTLKIS